MIRIWSALALALAGCVSTDAQMLDSRTMMISGSGSGWSSKSGVIKSIMREAATEGAKRGFQYFAILNASDSTTTGYYSPATTSNSTGVVGCTANFCNYSGSTNYGGVATLPIVRPGADVMVRFFREGEQPQAAFSVAEVLAQK